MKDTESIEPYNLGLYIYNGLPGGSEGKESACNAGDPGQIPRWGRPPGEGNGNPLQYSCLETPVDRGAWRAAVHRVAQSWTRLKQLNSSTHIYYTESESVSHSVMSDSAIAQTIASQAPLSMEFSRQEYWNGLPFLYSGGLSDPGIEPGSPALQADSLLSEPARKSGIYLSFLKDSY